MRRRTRWTLIVAGFLILVWLLWVGARVTDDPGFCASCHFMEPYVENWETSSHAGVNCIDCHYERGFLGYLQGKGRLVSEMFRYWIGAYNVRPHAQLSDENCISCHSREALEAIQTYSRNIEFSHRQHYRSPVRGMELTCSTCHSQLVQGSHTAVDQDTCILCHFVGTPSREPLGTCVGCHGPPQDDIAVDSIVFNHSDYLRSGVDCLTCHVHVTRGSGDVPPKKCYTCHVERFAQYGDTERVHRVHVTGQRIECSDCHTEVQHSKFEMAQTLSPNCQSCHGGHHSVQETVYLGTGGEGVPSMPDPMFLSGVTCAGCHRPVQTAPAALPGSGHALPRATPGACVNCHGYGYDWLLESWQQSIERYLGALQAQLSQTEQLFEGGIQSPSRTLETAKTLYREHVGKPLPSEVEPPSLEALREARRLYQRVQKNFGLVESDRSLGAHNVHYINALLKRAEADLDAIAPMLLIGPSEEPGEAQLYRSRFDCTRCHEGIQRTTLSTDRDRFSHEAHLEEGFECDRCHGVEDETHGKTFAEARSCVACHPSASQIREMTPQNCLNCHDARVEVDSELVRFSHEQHVPFGCGFCHRGAQQMDHLEFIQPRREPPLNHDICSACHAEDIEAGGNCMTCHEQF